MPRKAPARKTRTRSRKSVIAESAEHFALPAPDEKQALIHAHAERRKKHPPGNLFGMYLGVAICTILVLVGWAITLPKTFERSGRQSDGAIEAVREHGAEFTQSFSQDKPFENTAQLIEQMKKQAESAKK